MRRSIAAFFAMFFMTIILCGCESGGREMTPLHHAAYSGDLKLAKTLVSKGANVNARNKDGATPLHLALKRGHRDVAKLLINKGADVNAKDDKGLTPLSVAIVRGQPEMEKLLRSKGAREK